MTPKTIVHLISAILNQATIAGAGRLPQLEFAPGYQRSKEYSGGINSEYGLAHCST